MTNRVSVLFGRKTVPTKLKSWITTEEITMAELLDEIHPSEIFQAPVVV